MKSVVASFFLQMGVHIYRWQEGKCGSFFVPLWSYQI
jgi:hypothetical protein